MSGFLVDARGGRVIGVGAKAMGPAVVEVNALTVGIRGRRAWCSRPRNGSMGTMIT
jgi:hypothetical protein